MRGAPLHVDAKPQLVDENSQLRSRGRTESSSVVLRSLDACYGMRQSETPEFPSHVVLSAHIYPPSAEGAAGIGCETTACVTLRAGRRGEAGRDKLQV